jgi:hypothetical protein
MCPHRESNLELLLRRRPFYPLNYRGILKVLIYSLYDEKGKNNMKKYKKKQIFKEGKPA